MARTTPCFFRAQGNAACFIAEKRRPSGRRAGHGYQDASGCPMEMNAKSPTSAISKIAKRLAREGLVLNAIGASRRGLVAAQGSGRIRCGHGRHFANARGLHRSLRHSRFQRIGPVDDSCEYLAATKIGAATKMLTTQEAGLECYRRLSTGRYAISSELSGGAFGINAGLVNDTGWLGLAVLLEDTRKAKRPDFR